MKVIPFSRWVLLAACAAAVPSFAGDPIDYSGAKSPIDSPQGIAIEPAKANRWRVSAGAARRSFGDITLHTETQSAGLRLPSLFGKGFRHAPNAGPVDSPADRQYANGYVRPDAGTANGGLTWFWGYDDAAQVNGDTLTFNASGSARSIDSNREQSASGNLNSDDDSWGPSLSLDFMVSETDSLLWGLRTSFSYFSLSADRSGSTYEEIQQGKDFVLTLSDAYALEGVVPPQAPYQGTLAGPGALLNANPTSRTEQTSLAKTRTASFANSVQESLDLDLYTLSEGLFAEIKLGPVFTYAGAGVAIHFADWSVASSEQLRQSGNQGNRTVDSWSSSGSGLEVTAGAYAEAGIGVEISQRLSLHGFYRYDWADAVSGSAGLTSFEAELSGGSGGFGVRIGF